MVTVEVTYEDVTNALMLYFVTHQLHLCTFSAIKQIDLVAYGENLGGMVTVKRGCGRGATKNFQLKVQTAAPFRLFLFVCKVTLNLVQEHSVYAFLNGWQNVQHRLKLRDSDQLGNVLLQTS